MRDLNGLSLLLLQSDTDDSQRSIPHEPSHAPGSSNQSSDNPTAKESTNPFDEDEDKELAKELADSFAPPSVVTNHPWYSITQVTEASGTETPSHRANPAPAKDPPLLALVQTEPKKKPAPLPPPSLSASQHTGSVSALKGEDSRSTTPSQSTNPFDQDEDKELAEPSADSSAPHSVVTKHPWYSITQVTEASGSAPSINGKSSRSNIPPQSANPFDEEEELAEEPADSLALASVVTNHPWYSITQVTEASGSAPSIKGKSSRPNIPPQSTNPFDEEEELAEDPANCVAPPSVAANHPWYSIAQATEAFSSDALLHRDSHAPSKDPPWLTLIQAQSKKTPAPPPPRRSNPAPAATQGSGRKKRPAPQPPRPFPTEAPLLSAAVSPLSPRTSAAATPTHSKRTCKQKPFNTKASPAHPSPTSRPPCGPCPTRRRAPGHGFPRLMRKVQSDEYPPADVILWELGELDRQLDKLKQRGVQLDKRLKDCGNDEEEKHLLVDRFALITEKHRLVRRETELVYMAKLQNLDQRHTDVEYKLRCLINKPEKIWTDEDKNQEKERMAELVSIMERKNHIVDSMDQDRQREEEEEKMLAAMLQ